MNSPMQILQMFMSGGGNPQQLLMNALSMMGMNKNPMITNLINMANNGQGQQVEQFARNILKERGIDFDKEFAAFMQNINKR